LKKAAKVFPDPVGAKSSTFSPLSIFGHPKACGGVGEPKVSSNHVLSTG